MTDHGAPIIQPSAALETSACLARLTRLRELIAAEGLRGVVIARAEHIRYLTGWRGLSGPAVLVIADDAYLVVPAASYDPARAEELHIRILPYVPYDPHRLVDAIASSREATVALLDRIHLRGRVGVELDQLSFSIAAAIRAFEPVDVGRVISRWRQIKDPFEQLAIRRSVAALERGFRDAQTVIKPGVRELDLFAALQSAATEVAGLPVSLESNLGSGPRSALEDPHQTDRTLAQGDIVLVDLYPTIDGYVADLTRVFVVGPSTSEQRDRHAALEQALNLAAAQLRPGVLACDIDRTVRDELQRLMPELASSMTHHSGHGVGLQPWEEPWIGRSSEVEIAAGMVVAIEPGLYLPGIEGMRLEGNYLVTDAGVDRLDRLSSALIECAL